MRQPHRRWIARAAHAAVASTDDESASGHHLSGGALTGLTAVSMKPWGLVRGALSSDVEEAAEPAAANWAMPLAASIIPRLPSRDQSPSLLGDRRPASNIPARSSAASAPART